MLWTPVSLHRKKGKKGGARSIDALRWRNGREENAMNWKRAVQIAGKLVGILLKNGAGREVILNYSGLLTRE